MLWVEAEVLIRKPKVILSKYIQIGQMWKACGVTWMNSKVCLSMPNVRISEDRAGDMLVPSCILINSAVPLSVRNRITQGCL